MRIESSIIFINPRRLTSTRIESVLYCFVLFCLLLLCRVDEVEEDDRLDLYYPSSTRIIFTNPRRLLSTRIMINILSDIIFVRGGDVCFVIIIVVLY